MVETPCFAPRVSERVTIKNSISASQLADGMFLCACVAAITSDTSEQCPDSSIVPSGLGK
jgi:hypothetical protein